MRHELTFQAFGVRIQIVVHGQKALERAMQVLPPGSQLCASSEVNRTFLLGPEEEGTHELIFQGSSRGRLDLDGAIEVLDRELQALVALEAPQLTFVHAGAVACRDRAIIIPGRTFAGKSTLVAALVRAGAVYYSDEFAPLDEEGRIHPYPRPVSLRNEKLVNVRHPLDMFGGSIGTAALPVAMVLVTRYRPGAQWRPRALSAGEAVLEVLDNTVTAQTRPARALRAITRSVSDALAVRSDRGEAEAVVSWLGALEWGGPM